VRGRVTRHQRGADVEELCASAAAGAVVNTSEAEDKLEKIPAAPITRSKVAEDGEVSGEEEAGRGRGIASQDWEARGGGGWSAAGWQQLRVWGRRMTDSGRGFRVLAFIPL
jgi:hypothetical protein